MYFGAEERYVFGTVLVQSWIGLTVSGLFYGWGALSSSIDVAFSPEDPDKFSNHHGTFTGIIILVMSVIPMVPLRLTIDRGWLTEFQMQAYGLVVTVAGLVIGGLALNYKILWLLYVGCCLPCGVGSLMVFQRLVFNHQLWFKRIGQQNLGSGLFGFGIGLWTVIFFLVSVPLLEALSVGTILYVYAAVLLAATLWPLLTIDDNAWSKHFDDGNSKEDVSRLDIISCDNDHPTTIVVPCENAICCEEIYILPLDAEKEDSSGIIDQVAPSELHFVTAELDSMETLHDKEGLEKIALANGFSSLYDLGVGKDGMFDISYCEVIYCSQTWLLFAFFSLVLTPGWGIKLASFAMLRSLFKATSDFSAEMSSLYVAVYALGRLFSGFLAQKYGIVFVYDLMVAAMIVVLILIPQVVHYMDNSSQEASGCKLFLFLICILGFMV